MPDDTFASAILQLEHSPDAVPSLSNISSDDAAAIKRVIEMMYNVRTYSDVGVEEFADDVCDALIEVGQLQLADVAKFRERLARILSIDSLNVASKAVLLHNEHEHDFCSARILTDVRPVFGDDPGLPPAGVIIVHTLKLSYHEGAGGRLQEIYMSLGSHDIQELRDVLNRAETKAATLRASLEPTSLRIIDPQRE